MPEESAGDLDVLTSSINSSLLELQTIQSWKKEPDLYISGVANSVFVIMSRSYAPQAERLLAVIEREKKIPQALAAARQNLSNPPRVFTEVALQELPDTIKFFQRDVPKGVRRSKGRQFAIQVREGQPRRDCGSAQLREISSAGVVARIQRRFPSGRGDFQQEAALRRDGGCSARSSARSWICGSSSQPARLKKVAAEIDPNHTPLEVLAELRKDHPPADQLLQTFRDTLGGLRQFIVEKKIMTIPSTVPPIVEETPPFQRALTTASMDTPGAYETKATEAMFNVTLPGADWKPEKVEQWMQGFNRGTINSTAIHEVYPGHYMQFLWLQAAPSKTRKILYNNSNAEGWAHYTEQMMLDEGYGGHDPKLRIGQLVDALLRDARFIVGIEMHTGKMTLAQGQEFFVKEGYQVRPMAEVEAKRGTSDPTYLYYTLGKLQILKLREDYQKLRGPDFSLLEFHDRFMRQGSVPMRIIRKSMLGSDSPTL